MPRSGMFSFMHLGGLGMKRRAEDKKPDEPEEDEGREARRAEEEQPEHYEDDGKGKHAEKGEDNDGDEDEGEGRETARRAEDRGEPEADPDDDAEDEDDEEMEKAKAAGHGPALRAARRAERRRIGRILSSKHAQGRIATAAHLACNTGLSSAAAIGLLRTMPAEQAKASPLAEAMRRHGRVQPGHDGGQARTPGQGLIAAARELGKTLAERKRR